MGWAFGVNQKGREIGYGVEAICDEPGCDDKIDRGLGCVCGDMHDGGEFGCGDYFCGKHIYISTPEQLCPKCYEAYSKPNPPTGESEE